MTPQTKRLSDSISLRAISTDKFKTGMLSVSVVMPRTRTSSVYNYLLSGIMRRGTASYPTIASLNRRLDELYAATIEIKSAKYGKNETFTISAELLDNAYADRNEDIMGGVLDVIYELLFAPKLDENRLFCADDVRREKKIAVDNIRSIINNPRAYASARASELMNRDNADYLGLDASIEATEAITPADITEYYRKEIATRPLEVFYVGGLHIDELEEKLLARFSEHSAAKKDTFIPPAPLIAKREPISFSEEMPVSQGKLLLGFGTGVCLNSKDYYALVVLNEILGESPASKLFMNVREKKSLCYYCSSSYNMYNGTLRVSSGIDCADKEIALSAILSELDDIKRGKISDTEFFAAKKSLENFYSQIYDNPFELCAFYSARDVLGVPDTVENCKASLFSVTLDDVVRVSKNIVLDTEYFLFGSGGKEEDYDE